MALAYKTKRKMKLSEEMANIILLRYKEAGVFNPKYDKEPLPVDIEIAEEIVSKILDAAVEALYELKQHEKDAYNHHKDSWYQAQEYHLNRGAAIQDSIEAINKLRGE